MRAAAKGSVLTYTRATKMADVVPLPLLRLTSQAREDWITFKQQHKDYELINEFPTKKSKQHRAAVFRSCLGKEEMKIYKNLTYTGAEDKDDVETIISKMEANIIGEINTIYERFMFHQRVQKEDESMDTYVTALKELVRTCNYGVLNDELLRDRIVIGITDDTVRKILLQKRDLTLKDAIDICKAAEATKIQMSGIGGSTEETVHKIQSAKGKSRRYTQSRGQNATDGKASQWTRECKFCGQKHEFIKELCPAWGKKCAKCGRKNHTAAKCFTLMDSRKPDKKKNVYKVYEQTEDEDSDSDYETVMKVEESQSDTPE